MAYSIAARLITGSDPGRPRQTGQTSELGSPPNRFGQPQNILVLVPSSTWVSRPMTGSYRATASPNGTTSGMVGTVITRLPCPGRGPRRAVARRAASRSAASTAAATRYTRSSASTGAMICRPTGRPSSGARPHGTDSAALPARLDGIVHRSATYIAIGSSARSPMGNAVVGVVGETSTSTCSNAASKSRLMSVRTCCALP